MGKFDFNFDTNLIRQIEKLSNYDEIAERMLKETVPILERHVQNEVAKHKRTGALYKSIKAGKPVKNSYGWYASVFPTGTDENGVRNAEKLIYLEYGTSTEEATPVLTKALKDAEPTVTEKMQQIFNREVKPE
jgi:HK97 gp10 family phage protein